MAWRVELPVAVVGKVISIAAQGLPWAARGKLGGRTVGFTNTWVALHSCHMASSEAFLCSLLNRRKSL